MFQFGLKIYSGMVWLVELLQSPFLLIIRLYWGWQFFLAGKGKLGDIDKTVTFFKDLGIPMPMLNAYIAGLTECIGGLLIIIGLGSRLTSIPLIFTMIVAYATAHKGELYAIFQKPEAFLEAPPFLVPHKFQWN